MILTPTDHLVLAQGFEQGVAVAEAPVIREPAASDFTIDPEGQRAPVDQPAYWLKISVPLVPPKPKELLMVIDGFPGCGMGNVIQVATLVPDYRD